MKTAESHKIKMIQIFEKTIPTTQTFVLDNIYLWLIHCLILVKDLVYTVKTFKPLSRVSSHCPQLPNQLTFSPLLLFPTLMTQDSEKILIICPQKHCIII